MDQYGLNNRSNQRNPNNWLYQPKKADWKDCKAARDNRSNQLNPTHDQYYKSRSWEVPSYSDSKRASATEAIGQDSSSGLGWLGIAAVGIAAVATASYAIIRNRNNE